MEEQINLSLPLKTVTCKPKTFSKPWYSLGLKTSSKLKIKLYRKQIAKPTDANKRIYRDYKNMYNRQLYSLQK